MWGDVFFWGAILLAALILKPHTAAWTSGVILAAIAFPLWITARIQLGSALSFRPKASHLVTTGLYSRIRHPVYVFGTIAALGALLALQIWPLLAAGVALVPLTILRARAEGQVLAAAFGEEYERYRVKTWF